MPTPPPPPTLELEAPAGRRVTVAPRSSDDRVGELADAIGLDPRRPLCLDGRPVGLIPTSRLMEIPRDEWTRLTVGEAMLGLADVPPLTAEASLDDAMEALRRSPVRRVLVVDGERLVGLLSLDDVARTLGLRPVAP